MNKNEYEQVEHTLLELQKLVNNLLLIVRCEKEINGKLNNKLKDIEDTIEIMSKRVELIAQAAEKQGIEICVDN